MKRLKTIWKQIQKLWYPERWKSIKGYEGLYEISNYGRVKSLAKKWIAGRGGIYKKGITFLKKRLDKNGYFSVVLYNNKIIKVIKIHILVWDHFGNNSRIQYNIQVDHKDENKLNNRIDNLQLLTNRQNMSKSYIKKGSKTSIYTGVYWHKPNKKWKAQIQIHGIVKHLGYFVNEIDAHLAYQKALGEL